MGLFAQVEAFLLTFLLGIIVGLIFHYYQSVIKNLQVGRTLLYFLDLTIWIIMIIIIGIALLVINQAEIRAYVFIALVLGGLVYYMTAAPRLQQPMMAMGHGTAFVIKTVTIALSKPAKLTIIWLRVRYNSRRPPPADDEDE